jgi:hypothetical protein
MADASLWVQLTGEAVSGPRRDRRLATIPYHLVSWRAWVARHPETTVIDQDPALPKRYKKALPMQYFNSDRIPYAYAPAAGSGGPPPKSRIVAIERAGVRRVYPHGIIRRRAIAGDDATWSDTWDDLTVTFVPDLAGNSDTVEVVIEPPDADVEVAHAFWFVWKAMHPEDEVVGGGG